MERVENPMVRPIMEIVEMCEHCNGSGIIECTTCDYCKSNRRVPFTPNCNRCVIAEIPIGIDCPECGGTGHMISER